MKALTLTQPWAQLVVEGRKVFETRSWRTSWHGRLAIHAAKGWTADDRAFARELGYEPEAMVRGAVVGEAVLIRCQGTEDLRFYLRTKGERGAFELSAGDFADGRWAWRLAHPETYAEPIPAKGSLGLWDWTKPIEDLSARNADHG